MKGEPYLTRLSLYSKLGGKHIVTAASEGMAWVWKLKIPLESVPGIASLGDLDESTLAEILGDLLSRGPNLIFDWVIGSEDVIEP